MCSEHVGRVASIALLLALDDLDDAAGADPDRYPRELVLDPALALTADDRLELALLPRDDRVDHRVGLCFVLDADDPRAREQRRLTHDVRGAGDDDSRPSSMPYQPLEGTAIERSPSAPSTQSRTWSIAAFAADAADDAPRASMIAAPRLPTAGMYSFSYQSMSTWSTARWPLAFALKRSGNIVGEWLPQITRSWTSSTPMPSFFASIATARFSSRRVIAVKRSAGMSGAFDCAINALVLAGLPTTRIFTSSAAPEFSASPCGLKMAPLASSRSARSMPLARGRAPTRRATLTP